MAQILEASRASIAGSFLGGAVQANPLRVSAR